MAAGTVAVGSLRVNRLGYGAMQITGPGVWGAPQDREECKRVLRRAVELGVDFIDTDDPAEDSLGELADLQREGKINHIGLSEVDVDEIASAAKVVEIASVQNLYNLTNRRSEAVLDHCAENGIAFIPWFPIATGR